MALLKQMLVLAAVLAILLSPMAYAQPPSSDQMPRVGELVDKREIVKGNLPGQSPGALEKGAGVFERMRVETGMRSAGRFAVGSRQGAIVLGPESSLVFLRALIDFATGVVRELGISMDRAQSRFFFVPRPREGEKVLGVPPHEVVIKTPSGRYTLRGTDIFLDVTEDRTILFVYEGAVEVEPFSGPKVVVKAGYWTKTLGREPAQPPAPFDKSIDPFSPETKGRAFDVPGEWLVPGPILLDPRLDVPR